MDRLRVLTLNIWNRQGPWEQRLPLIRRGIERLQPHLVGLQEVLRHDAVDDDQARQIAAGLDYQAAFGKAWDIGGGLQFGNAVLSRFPIASQQVWALPVGAGDEPRALLHVEVDAPFGRVPFFVTHLNWKLHESAVRCRQVLHIAERVAESAPPGGDRFPPILVGDFNAEPESDEIRFLRGHHVLDGRSVYFADCLHVAGDGGPGYTFARRNPFALVAREPNRRLDYVFVRGPDRRLIGEPLGARVVLDEEEDGVFPSDHFGVLAEISAAPPAA
jgi:endonuclease/exonuclease/phosphatase family metal-dependent hydrolase